MENPRESSSYGPIILGILALVAILAIGSMVLSSRDAGTPDAAAPAAETTAPAAETPAPAAETPAPAAETPAPAPAPADPEPAPTTP